MHAQCSNLAAEILSQIRRSHPSEDCSAPTPCTDREACPSIRRDPGILAEWRSGWWGSAARAAGLWPRRPMDGWGGRCVRARVHVHAHAHAQMCMCMCMCMCMLHVHVHVHACACAYACHMCTWTWTQAPATRGSDRYCKVYDRRRGRVCLGWLPRTAQHASTTAPTAALLPARGKIMRGGGGI